MAPDSAAAAVSASAAAPRRPPPNPPGLYKYVSAPGLMDLIRFDYSQQKALHAAVGQCESERKASREALKQVEAAKKTNAFIPVTIGCLSHMCQFRMPDSANIELQKMLEYHAAVEAVGGIHAIRKMKKLCDDDAAAKSQTSQTTKPTAPLDINRTYRDNISKRGLAFQAVYMVEWDTLYNFHSSNKLPVAYSFATLLTNCEAASKNPDADPDKIHLRLALVAGNDSRELYCEYRNGMMQKVTTENAKELFDKVFSDDNVKILRSADGEFCSFDEYKSNLTTGSVIACRGVCGLQPVVSTYMKTAGEFERRVRSNNRPSKCARHGA